MTPKVLTLACAMAMTAIASAQAADVQKDEAEKKVHALDTIVVQDVADRNGQKTLTSVELDVLPSYSGTISDAFRGNSAVQYDAGSRNGTLGAEITPPKISIRGSRNYENNFLINGLSNNSVLNPMGYGEAINNQIRPSLDRDPSGDAQAIMLDTDLLESLTILSENVSAEYGNFTGGVVNAQIRDAKMDRWHVKTWVRHSRDAWAKMHLTDKQEKNEYPQYADQLQKEFTYTKVGAVFEGPLFDNKLGAMFSYEKTHTHAPVYLRTGGFGAKAMYQEKKSERDKENFMLRVNTDKNADFSINSTLIYSPYESNIFMADGRLDGERNIEGGGWNWSVATVSNLALGRWTNDFSYAENEASWDATSNTSYEWHVNQNDINWTPNGFAKEGMFGDRELTQKTFNFKSILALNPINLGDSTHNIKVGVEALHTKVKYDIEGYTRYNVPIKNTTSTALTDDKANGIWQNQWASKRDIGHAANKKEDFTQLSAFIEDEITYGRFTMRPGVRIEHEDVSDNVNIAPRFNIEADVLNNDVYHINAGFNRYYGNQILSKAVSMKNRISYEKRTSPDDDWVQARPDRSASYENLGDVDTPYSNEYVLGLSANVLNGTLFKVQGVLRDYKDQLKTSEASDAHLTNEGESSYKGVTFTIEKAYDLGVFGRHYSEFGATWSKLEGNATNWMDSWNERPGALGRFDHVWIDDEKVMLEDVPATNFNSDWVLTYQHRAFLLDDRLRSTLMVRYETPHDGLIKLKQNNPDGANQYRTVENKSFVNADLNIDYDLIKTVNSTLTINVEILNLFDKDNVFQMSNMMPTDPISTMGRQFFLGMTYNY